MNFISVALIPLFLFSSFAAPWPDLSVSAPSQGAHPGDAAVVVGVERYAFVPPVPGASRSAEDWQLYLTKTRGLPAEKVRLIRDNEATLEELRDAASWAAAAVEPGGTLWFVFIGHGAPGKDGKEGILVGVDAQQRASSLFARSLGQTELLALLGKGKQGKTVAVLDACFSGRTAEGAALVPGLQPLIAVQTAGTLPANAVVLTAGKTDQFAGPLPGSERPAFSYLLLGALRGWGDSNGDGSVTAAEAVDYARRALQALLRDRQQTPESNGSVAGALASGAKETGPDLAAMAGAARPASDISFGKVERIAVPKLPEIGGATGSYREVDVELERLLEEAVTLERSKSAAAFDKMSAWCRLAQAKKDNPYAGKAKEACAAWEGYADRELEQDLRLLDDYFSLQGYLGLKLKSPEQKAAAVDAFLAAYKALAGKFPVAEVKKAKEELAQGRAPALNSILALDKEGGVLPVSDELKEMAAVPNTGGYVSYDSDRVKCGEGNAKGCAGLAYAIKDSDRRRSVFNYEIACRLGSDGQDCYKAGEALGLQSDYGGAMELARLACAARADANACLSVARWIRTDYSYGSVSIPAEHWPRIGQFLQVACLKGAAAACKSAGEFFERGGQLPRDWPRARLLYGLACRGRDLSSCDSFKSLDSKEREASRMERWLGGDAEALPELEKLFSGPKADSLKKCRADPQMCFTVGDELLSSKPFAAVEALRRSCEAGHWAGCEKLAKEYERGAYVPVKSPSLALHFNLKGCDLRNGGACAEAARAYRAGNGAEKSLEKAFELMRRACDSHTNQCVPLGQLYFVGEGVEKSEEKAREAWTRVCALDYGWPGCYPLVINFKDPEATKRLKAMCRKNYIEVYCSVLK